MPTCFSSAEISIMIMVPDLNRLLYYIISVNVCDGVRMKVVVEYKFISFFRTVYKNLPLSILDIPREDCP